MRKALIFFTTMIAAMIICTAMSFAATDISDNWMILVKPDVAYKGTAVCPKVTVVQKDDYLIYNDEEGENYSYDVIYENYMERGEANWDVLLPSAYTVEYSNNVNSGYATVTVTPLASSGFEGQLTQKFHIYRTKATFTKTKNSDYSITINSKDIKDKLVSIKCDGYKLIEGTDYSVLSNGNIKIKYTFLAGTKRMLKGTSSHDLDLSFKNHYAELTVKGYNINSYTNITPSELVYSGKTKSPVSMKGLTKGTHYKVVYSTSKRASIGKHYYTVKGIAPYKGSFKTYYKVIPKKPAFGTITRKSTYIKINWKKVANCSGYQIKLLKISPDYGETDEEDSTITTTYKTVTVSGKSTTYKKITATKTKYNAVQIRAYKTVNGKKYYSNITKKEY